MSCATRNGADAYGSFEANEIIVSAEVNGAILNYLKSEGETVTAGEIVTVIDTTNYFLNKQEIEKALSMIELKIETAQQQKKILEIEKQNAITNRDRISNLTEQNAAPQKQLDDLEISLQIIDEKLKLAQTNIQLARKEYETNLVKLDKANLILEKCYVKAPQNGTILENYNLAGEFTVAGKPLFKLADISKMKAIFYLGEPQLAGLKLGDQIKVFIDAGEGIKEFSGQLTFISEKAEFTPKTIQTKDERVKLVYKAEAEVINNGSIKIGMPLELRF
jgi:HlyD family secretion protein